MFIQIQKGSSTPISRQISEQIMAQCASGALQAGDRLPSVRELARKLTVNQNTILRVYDRLSAEGLLEARHGEGTFVAANSRKRQFDQERKQLLDELQLLARRGTLLEIDSHEMRRLFDEALSQASSSVSAAKTSQ